MKRRAPRSLAAELERYARALAPSTPLAQIQRTWQSVAGEALAREAQPTAERGGIVTLSCSSAVWAQELDLMSDELVERLNAALGRPLVKALRCVARAPRR